MWLPIWHGNVQLWVEHYECRLETGELAFVTERIPIPLPDWFTAPEGSMIRSCYDSRDEVLERFETRSRPDDVSNVIAFYRERVRDGCLAVKPDEVVEGLPGRCQPGFQAASVNDGFAIDAYQWRETAFWTTRLWHPTRQRKDPRAPLMVVSRTSERVMLSAADGTGEYWASADAVKETCPDDDGFAKWLVPQEEPKRVPWFALPPWLQVPIQPRPESLLELNSEGHKEWSEDIVLSSEKNPYDVFNCCLELLDGHGIDRAGEGGSDSSYFVQVLAVWPNSSGAHRNQSRRKSRHSAPEPPER